MRGVTREVGGNEGDILFWSHISLSSLFWMRNHGDWYYLGVAILVVLILILVVYVTSPPFLSFLFDPPSLLPSCPPSSHSIQGMSYCMPCGLCLLPKTSSQEGSPAPTGGSQFIVKIESYIVVCTFVVCQ